MVKIILQKRVNLIDCLDHINVIAWRVILAKSVKNVQILISGVHSKWEEVASHAIAVAISIQTRA